MPQPASTIFFGLKQYQQQYVTNLCYCRNLPIKANLKNYLEIVILFSQHYFIYPQECFKCHNCGCKLETKFSSAQGNFFCATCFKVNCKSDRDNEDDNIDETHFSAVSEDLFSLSRSNIQGLRGEQRQVLSQHLHEGMLSVIQNVREIYQSA